MSSAATAASPGGNDRLILVDEHDRECGVASKAECHRGHGLLHRAFSVFLQNPRGEILLQQRGPQKPLWPGFWSNSCCSHPRPGESSEAAALRRVREELGVDCELNFLYKFRYQADFGEVGAEHEYCWVFLGRTSAKIVADPDEIAAWEYVSPGEITRRIAADEARFTPWMKMEWRRITAEFADLLSRHEP